MPTRSAAALRNPVADFRRSQSQQQPRFSGLAFPDIWLMIAWFALVVIGMVMVTSASMSEAVSHNASPLYFSYRQLAYYGLGLVMAYVVFQLPTNVYYEHGSKLLLVTFLMLFLVFVPGIGSSVNGAHRWINFRVFNFQVGELVKLVMILYAAGYLQRHNYCIENSWKPMLGLLAIGGVFAVVLLKQPDFGTTFVMMMTLMGMLFMAGVSIKRYSMLVGVVSFLMVAALLIAPYRRARLTSFLDPWEKQFDQGYQLVNSLIAVGRGGVSGVGLGESVQKHQYLPEAHTDFIFAIISEELGLIGALVVMGLLALVVWRAFAIGKLADQMRKRFASYIAYGIGLWVGCQSLINIGVATGALPTKGLTLPFISYGGSSVLILFMALAILLRIDAESRFQAKREGLL
ncbi:MAG: putative lipid II flippase FtsW [Cardiobacteriaceae bacterium]|nr:putative lipid II flippase FtsW [Cardiobacteriaceae bacterium]